MGGAPPPLISPHIHLRLTFAQLLSDGLHPLRLVLAAQPLRHAPGVQGQHPKVPDAPALLDVLVGASPLVLKVDEIDGQGVTRDYQGQSHQETQQAFVASQARATSSTGKEQKEVQKKTFCKEIKLS